MWLKTLQKNVTMLAATKFYYGGQAVMEGVMMRGRNFAAVAGRRPDGSLYIYEEPLHSRLYQSRIFRLPFLRGMLLLWETLNLGTRMMALATNVTTGALDPDGFVAATVATEQGQLNGFSQQAVEVDIESTTSINTTQPAIGGLGLALSMLISLGMVVAVFFVGPLLLVSLLSKKIGQTWLNPVLEGVIRLALLVGYLTLIGRVPDIERVFGYHGAEHKAINTMERGEPLDVAHVRLASRVHTRCGTGFLLLVMILSIFVFALFSSPSLLARIISRIVLVPVVAGIAYELMRLGAANEHFRVVRWLLAPGLALQGLTTREPDDSMIECAIAALQRVMLHDK